MAYTEKELKDLATWYELIEKNPEAKDKLYEAMEMVNPDVNIPERKVKKEISKQKEEVSKDVEKKVRQLLAERDAKEYMERNRESLKEEGYSDEEITQIEKLMQEENIKKYNIARSHFDREMRAVKEPTYSIGSAPEEPLIDKDFVKNIKDNPDYGNFYGHKVYEEEKAKRLAMEKKRFR